MFQGPLFLNVGGSLDPHFIILDPSLLNGRELCLSVVLYDIIVLRTGAKVNILGEHMICSEQNYRTIHTDVCDLSLLIKIAFSSN